MEGRLKLRLLSAADHGTAIALYQALVPVGTKVQTDPGAFQAVLDHPGTSVHGAEVDGAVRAMATLHVLPNLTHGGHGYAILENVVTAPDWRGRGLGRAVIEHIIARAWGADCHKIVVATGPLPGTRDFYEKLGFRSDPGGSLHLRRGG